MTFSAWFRLVLLQFLFIAPIFAGPTRRDNSDEKTFVSMMLPVQKGEHLFNRHGDDEWEIQRDSNVLFAIYGQSSVGFSRREFFVSSRGKSERRATVVHHSSQFVSIRTQRSRLSAARRDGRSARTSVGPAEFAVFQLDVIFVFNTGKFDARPSPRKSVKRRKCLLSFDASGF